MRVAGRILAIDKQLRGSIVNKSSKVAPRGPFLLFGGQVASVNSVRHSGHRQLQHYWRRAARI